MRMASGENPGTNRYERVPKVELHLHLEGAIPPAAFWELLQKYGGDPDVLDIESLRRRITYRDFPHFVNTWVWQTRFLREYEDFTFIAAAVARDLARQNIRYVEAFFSPSDFARHSLTTQGLATAIRDGLQQVPQVEVALVADLVRDRGPEHGARQLEEVNEVRDQGVIGIGIGGSEHRVPPEVFAAVYARARELGLHTSAHAGEVAGAASIWGAIRALQVERIGHGTRASEDEALLDYLAEHRIPLEMCPVSNLRTGVIPSYTGHPARRFFERGIMVTINTDDPALFGTSLAEEYRLLEEQLEFSRADIRTLMLNAIQAAWLPDERKQHMSAELCADPVWATSDQDIAS